MEARAVSEGKLWRVYCDEWSVAYVSEVDGGSQECTDRFRSHYEGSVGQDEWRVAPWSEEDPGGWPWMLELRVPVMKGEYLSEDVAEGVASRLAGKVAREGSDLDAQLQRRGNVLIRKAQG